MTEPPREVLREEFKRAAPTFTERTRGRFDDMNVSNFSRVKSGSIVAEVGAGTGHFLSLFADRAALMLAIDLIPEMLYEARRQNPGMATVVADGARLPLASRSVDLAASAQAFHHIAHPVEVLKEMRRVVRDEGRVLVVDQIATEKFEEAIAMNELDLLRDPSHVASRPASALRLMVAAAGLEPVDELLWGGPQRLSAWMWPGEFPEERIDAVRRFIETRGAETGMNFERDGDDWLFTRRRIMLLASRAPQ